jgi:hypothetical protein
MTKKYTAMYFVMFITIFIILFLLLALGIQWSYNNSIPEMSKDVETGKERLNKINYGTACAFLALLFLIPGTTVIYNAHLDNK